VVLIELPPPKRPPNPLYSTLEAGTSLRRIFDPTRHGTQALTFRHYGPINRFDHHRVSDEGEWRSDPERGIYYAAFTLSGCLVEIFGDSGVIEIKDQEVALVEVTRPLTLLDLRGSGAMRSGSVSALAKVADRLLSQAWSRYFYEQQEIYGKIDGIRYYNAHNDEDAIALYERAQDALFCRDDQILRLEYPRLRPAIQKAALDNHLEFLG
jgi:hypothetical protein